MNDGKPKGLDSEILRKLFLDIGRRMADRGSVAEIALYGGSAIVLTIGGRDSTHDVDFVGVAGDTDALLKVTSEIASEKGLPSDWFNDAVRLVASPTPDYSLFGDFPQERTGLRVFTATPSYLLSMKLLKMRSALESHDVEDVWNLLDHCGVVSVKDAEKYIAAFFPGDRIPERNAAILEDILAAKANGQSYDPMIGW